MTHSSSAVCVANWTGKTCIMAKAVFVCVWGWVGVHQHVFVFVAVYSCDQQSLVTGLQS